MPPPRVGQMENCVFSVSPVETGGKGGSRTTEIHLLMCNTEEKNKNPSQHFYFQILPLPTQFPCPDRQKGCPNTSTPLVWHCAWQSRRGRTRFPSGCPQVPSLSPRPCARSPRAPFEPPPPSPVPDVPLLGRLKDIARRMLSGKGALGGFRCVCGSDLPLSGTFAAPALSSPVLSRALRGSPRPGALNSPRLGLSSPASPLLGCPMGSHSPYAGGTCAPGAAPRCR